MPTGKCIVCGEYDHSDTHICKTAQVSNSRLIDWLSGCGNHGCQIMEPQGVATNGRCRCIDKITSIVLDRLSVGPTEPRNMVAATIKLLIELGI